MKIGDVVIAVGTFQLACGSGRYSHAICVSVDPFIMVSEHGDMKWSSVDINDVRPLCQASEAIVKVAMDRLARDKARDEAWEAERAVANNLKESVGFGSFDDALAHAEKPDMVIKEYPATVQGILEAAASKPNYIMLDPFAYSMFGNSEQLSDQMEPPEGFSALQHGYCGKLNGVHVWVILDDEQEIARVLTVRDMQTFR